MEISLMHFEKQFQIVFVYWFGSGFQTTQWLCRADPYFMDVCIYISLSIHTHIYTYTYVMCVCWSVVLIRLWQVTSENILDIPVLATGWQQNPYDSLSVLGYAYHWTWDFISLLLHWESKNSREIIKKKKPLCYSLSLNYFIKIEE